MVALPLSATCCVTEAGTQRLDPCLSEEASARAAVTLAVLSGREGVLTMKVSPMLELTL